MMTGRHHEITFYYIIEHIKTLTTNEKLPLFLEMFAIVFDIDYTNLTILYHQYHQKIRPSVKDVALMARDLGISVRRFPINWNYAYTLIRNNRDTQLSPMIYNEGLVETMVEFNKKYIRISEQHPEFMKEIDYDAS
jgi:hypothetical protein